ncbi:MAG: NAD(P)H-dependent oxidoreductase [bacterium]
MKLLALLGYPRPHGHTARLADLFLKGAAAAGAEIDRAELPTMNIHPCLGCYACWTKTPGQCVQQDDMAGLLERFMAADLVFIASPIYAFSVSSYMKQFMERTLPLFNPSAEIDANGVEHNKWRNPGRGPKRLAALLVAGLKTPGIFKPVTGMMELYAEEVHMQCSGIMLRPESSAMRFPQAKPLRAKAILTGCERAGAEFVTKPRISQALLDDIAAPLLADLPHFVEYSRVFWEHALESGDECDAAGEAAGLDMRILIREMVRNADLAALRSVTATLQFEFPDQHLVYTVTIRNGACSIMESSCPAPTLLIRCPAALWAAVTQRRIAGVQLLNHPDLHLEGDLQLFRRLPRYFPPPTD